MAADKKDFIELFLSKEINVYLNISVIFLKTSEPKECCG